jgi:hypothetical protein
MSERPSSHEQAPGAGLTPEEFQDALNTLHGMQGMFADIDAHLPQDQSAEARAMAVDGQLLPMVHQYLYQGEVSGEKPGGRDVLAAMVMGAAQHPADIEGLAATIGRGGRVRQEVLDTLYRDAHNRADMRSRQPDIAAEAEPRMAAAVEDDVAKGLTGGVYAPGSTESRVLYAYAAGVYAQFPAHAQESNAALAQLQPEVPPVESDFSRFDKRLGGEQ